MNNDMFLLLAFFLLIAPTIATDPTIIIGSKDAPDTLLSPTQQELDDLKNSVAVSANAGYIKIPVKVPALPLLKYGISSITLTNPNCVFNFKGTEWFISTSKSMCGFHHPVVPDDSFYDSSDSVWYNNIIIVHFSDKSRFHHYRLFKPCNVKIELPEPGQVEKKKKPEEDRRIIQGMDVVLESDGSEIESVKPGSTQPLLVFAGDKVHVRPHTNSAECFVSPYNSSVMVSELLLPPICTDTSVSIGGNGSACSLMIDENHLAMGTMQIYCTGGEQSGEISWSPLMFVHAMSSKDSTTTSTSATTTSTTSTTTIPGDSEDTSFSATTYVAFATTDSTDNTGYTYIAVAFICGMILGSIGASAVAFFVYKRIKSYQLLSPMSVALKLGSPRGLSSFSFSPKDQE